MDRLTLRATPPTHRGGLQRGAERRAAKRRGAWRETSSMPSFLATPLPRDAADLDQAMLDDMRLRNRTDGRGPIAQSKRAAASRDQPTSTCDRSVERLI
jgi:hypothetical protein